VLALAFAALLLWGGEPARGAGPPQLNAAARRWMRSLTLREKVAQLIFVPFNGAAPHTRSREYARYLKLVRDIRVGGLILVNWAQGRVIQKAAPYELATFSNRMQRLAKVPLLVGADLERGASMRVDGTTVFPHAMAFGAAGDPALTRYEGEVTAREARALGIHWVYYPVADVNNNPDNPIINIRSFGEDPQQVAAHVRAFIEGTRADLTRRVLTTAKHFPGHGDTAVDSHVNLAAIPADKERLRRLELVPFQAAIAAGVDSIMTAHVAVPALAPADVPATLSPRVLTGLLRKELGFRGLVVTDALEMGGIAKGYQAGEAAVLALEAGADALLMTPDPEAALEAVLAAVRKRRLSQKRIEESVVRILRAKQRVGLDRRRYVNLEAIEDQVNAPEAVERAQEIADRAVTLVKNERDVVPLRAPARTCFLVLAESRYASGGQVFAEEVRRREKQALVLPLDPSLPAAEIDNVVARTAGCQTVVAAAFASVGAYRGDLALPGDYPRLLEGLTARGQPVVLVALGNPYLLRSFPRVDAYLATFSTVPPSEIAAVRALLGEIPIRGRLPVTIPGAAKRGHGIQLPAGGGP
jgi:beta-N-acetylhexosaminidase